MYCDRPLSSKKASSIAVTTRKKDVLLKGIRWGAGWCPRRRPRTRDFHTSEGTGRSTVRSQAIFTSAGRKKRQASKQARKNEQCGSNPPKGMPQANSYSTWALVCQEGYRWQFANCRRRYATNIQLDIRTVPVRFEDGDTRLSGRGLSRAREGGTARAAAVVEGRRSVPIGGRWRLVGVGRNRLTTHARACVAGSLRCWSDRRLRGGRPAQVVPRMCVRGCGGGRGGQG